jgi:hypothetical protein
LNLDRIKVRLRKTHFVNGVRRDRGVVIRLVPGAARLLVEMRVADIIRDTATDPNRNRRNNT